MAYDGYINFGGRELVNLSRTTELATTLGIDVVWTTPQSVEWIHDEVDPGALYNDITDAPWYVPNYPASAEFAGFIPLSFTGFDDSTTVSTPEEYITDGGNSGSPRNETLTLVANFAVIAATERGAEYGKKWLDRVLHGDGNQMFCSGSDLRYFQYGSADAPIMHRRNVRLTRGTSVTRKRTTDCSSTWLVTFTMVAADPYEYSEPQPGVFSLGSKAPGLSENLVPDPTGENVNVWDSGRGFGTGGAGTYSVATGTTPLGLGKPFRRKTWTTAPTSNASSGFFINGSAGAPNVRYPVTEGESYTFGVYVRHSPANKVTQARIVWGNAGGALSITDGVSQIEAPSTWGWRTVWGVAPAGATQAWLIADAIAGGSLWGAGNTMDATGAVFRKGTGPIDPNEVFAVSGNTMLTQEPCPAFDYTPIYDPLYPALVPPPTVPDFYPEGWPIVDGGEFMRYWVDLPPVDPATLHAVPVITVTTDVEARGIRVSIWPGSADATAQCDPLFTATITYLPPGGQFVIDGEREASYFWDGFSPVVRRTDSLVYDLDAEPVDWTKFNDFSGLRVTLDVPVDDGSYQGDQTVRASVAFVTKSD